MKGLEKLKIKKKIEKEEILYISISFFFSYILIVKKFSDVDLLLNRGMKFDISMKECNKWDVH